MKVSPLSDTERPVGAGGGSGPGAGGGGTGVAGTAASSAPHERSSSPAPTNSVGDRAHRPANGNASANGIISSVSFHRQ